MSANIIQLVTAAIDEFSDCTWTHENWGLARDEDGQPIHCSGGQPDTCETCREARDSAKSAQQFGREALALLKGQPGNGATPRQVLDLVKQARDCEVQWGDAPAWGPAFEAIREIADRGPVSASLKYGNKGCDVYGWTWRLEFDAGVEVDGEWDADADDDAVGHLESLVTREGGSWGGGTFTVSDLGGSGCLVAWTSGIVYRIRFAAAPDKIERSDVGIGSESDALSYANGCADRFGGRRARSYSAGALFAEVTIPGDERQAFEEMLDDDALVAGYSELES